MNKSFKNIAKPSFNCGNNGIFYDDMILNNNKEYNYLEYIPLVNASTHLLGSKRKILNDSFKNQYEKCLYRCSYKSTCILDLNYCDILSLLYYSLLVAYYILLKRYIISMLFLLIITTDLVAQFHDYLGDLFNEWRSNIVQIDICLFHTTFQLLPLVLSIAIYDTNDRFIDIIYIIIHCYLFYL